VAKHASDVPADIEQKSWSDRISLVREVLGIVAILALPAFAVRALVVASFDSSVAGAIVVNTSMTGLVNAWLLTVTPIILTMLPLVAGLYIIHWAKKRNWKPWQRNLSLLTVVPLVVPGFLQYDVSVPIILGWAANTLGTITSAQNGVETEDHSRKALRGVLAYIFLIVAAIFVIPKSMWLPPEKVELQGGEPKKVYILSSSADDLVVFDPKQQTVLRLPTKEVKSRQYCDETGNRRTLANKIWGKPSGRPQCP
jgi:hypothetical protein